MFTLENYTTEITDPLMCYSSAKDWCSWKESGFKLDVFDKLRTDEWQICSDQSGWTNTDPSTEPKAHICATNYPGNV